MKEKTLVKENKIKIIWNMLWNEDSQEIEDVEEIKDIDKKTLKELKEGLKGVKALEDKYGIEPKNTKRKSPIIKKATVNYKGDNQETNNKEKDDEKIQEI